MRDIIAVVLFIIIASLIFANAIYSVNHYVVKSEINNIMKANQSIAMQNGYYTDEHYNNLINQINRFGYDETNITVTRSPVYRTNIFDENKLIVTEFQGEYALFINHNSIISKPIDVRFSGLSELQPNN